MEATKQPKCETREVKRKKKKRKQRKNLISFKKPLDRIYSYFNELMKCFLVSNFG